jgi:hypothetical protein
MNRYVNTPALNTREIEAELGGSQESDSAAFHVHACGWP